MTPEDGGKVNRGAAWRVLASHSSQAVRAAIARPAATAEDQAH